jgi:hypothetical protein
MAVQIWKPRSAFAAEIDHLNDFGARMYAPGQFTCDVAGNCLDPRPVTVSYTDQHRSKYRTWRGNVDYTVPCRKCDNCVKRRRWHWTQRISTEIGQADRSWFGTLTLEPEAQFRAILRAERLAERKGHRWSQLTDMRRFYWHVSVIAPEITLFLKRVRKNSGAMLRYCLVAERHKSGYPHFHAVLHHGAVPVLHRHLKDAWRLGFSDFKLVEERLKVARYVAKYLTKALGTRVRASARYGYRTSSDIPTRAGEGVLGNSLHKGKSEGEARTHSSERPASASSAPMRAMTKEGTCTQCNGALIPLYGHYVKEHSEGLPERRVGDERLSYESPRCSAPGSSVSARSGDQSGSYQSSVALSATGETSPSLSEAAAFKVAAGSGCAEPGVSVESSLSQSAESRVAVVRSSPVVWVCPNGCITDAPIALWLGPVD